MVADPVAVSNPTSAKRVVAVLAFDIEEASQIRAIRAMRAAGVEVLSLSYRRGHMNAGFRPEWRDLPLGPGADGTGWARVAAVLRGVWRIAREGNRVGPVDCIVARNLDMALLGLVLRLRVGTQVPLIYQCFDVHGLMTGRGPAAWLARLAERAVLRRTARLVVSAPDFLRCYFEPVQGFDGAAMVLENRIFWGGRPPPRPAAAFRSGPLRLGLVGTLRCPVTLALLLDLAASMGPDRIQIVLRGVVHHHQLPGFLMALRGVPNVVYEGRYEYPHGLARAYEGLDAVWAQDLWQAGTNSDWLLPNRLYEAGFFGCPAIAVRGTATAARIEKDGSGLVAEAATAEAVAECLGRRAGELPLISARLLSLPAERFCQSPEEIRAMLELPCDAEARAGRSRSPSSGLPAARGPTRSG